MENKDNLSNDNKYEYDPTNLFDTPDDIEEYQYYKGCSIPSHNIDAYNYVPPISANNFSEGITEITLDELDEMLESGEIDEDTYNNIMQQVEDYNNLPDNHTALADSVYSGLVNVYQTLAQLFSMAENIYSDEYTIGHDESHDWCVDTCEVDEEENGYRYETAVAHLDFNHGNFVIVQATNDENTAKEIHNKWVNDLKNNKINILVDINTCDVYQRKSKSSNNKKDVDNE